MCKILFTFVIFFHFLARKLWTIFYSFFLHWPKSLSNVTMAGNARCQIWGPTAGKHHQKSVIWVTVFEDMNKFTNRALTIYTIKSFKSEKCLSVKQILEWKSKTFPLLYYSLLHRSEHWKATAHLDVSFLPFPLPLLSLFRSSFISRAAKTENPVPRSFFAPKPNGNACYAGYLILK